MIGFIFFFIFITIIRYDKIPRIRKATEKLSEGGVYFVANAIEVYLRYKLLKV